MLRHSLHPLKDVGLICFRGVWLGPMWKGCKEGGVTYGRGCKEGDTSFCMLLMPAFKVYGMAWREGGVRRER